jgi:hypothetical protein
MTTEKGGPAVKWETPELMQEAINAYYADCELKEKPLTITGLACALDLTRKGLIDYSNKSDEFGNTIKKAKALVEKFNEEQLYRTGQVTGVIFNLKNNFGWKDAQDVNMGGQAEGVPLNLKVNWCDKPTE